MMFKIKLFSPRNNLEMKLIQFQADANEEKINTTYSTKFNVP